MAKPNHLYWFLVLGLSGCASHSSLPCWERAQLQPHTPSEQQLAAIMLADKLAALDRLAASFTDETEPYVLYRYHLKRSSLEGEPLLRTAFKEYALELRERAGEEFNCHE